jgi:FAD-dependent urate hydroxylase
VAGRGTGGENDGMADTGLLVIGAGPYAYSAAAYAMERGIGTRIVGRPMGFWRDQMPVDMFLRSGRDWSLDASGTHSFEAYFEERGLEPAANDPIPIGVFLDHTEWFAEQKGLDVAEIFVDTLHGEAGDFTATMSDGSTITAEKVLAAPGIAHFAQRPEWYDVLPDERRSHTSELVSFDGLAGARVAVIGGRQSAYEWAALLCDHGAERVDVVHRHDTPAFERVSWAFVNPYVEQTLTHRGWWRSLTAEQQRAIALEFWRVGRLTLEHWLVPRLRPEVVHSHPRTEVVRVDVGDAVHLTLSDGDVLEVDHVTCASGYRADLAAVPYLAGVLDRVSVTDGFPDLSSGFETTLPGLFVTGFASTRDFGPFYGFTKGCPSAARIAVDEMLR